MSCSRNLCLALNRILDYLSHGPHTQRFDCIFISTETCPSTTNCSPSFGILKTFSLNCKTDGLFSTIDYGSGSVTMVSLRECSCCHRNQAYGTCCATSRCKDFNGVDWAVFLDYIDRALTHLLGSFMPCGEYSGNTEVYHVLAYQLSGNYYRFCLKYFGPPCLWRQLVSSWGRHWHVSGGTRGGILRWI